MRCPCIQAGIVLGESWGLLRDLVRPNEPLGSRWEREGGERRTIVRSREGTEASAEAKTREN